MLNSTAIRLRTLSHLARVFRTMWRGYKHRQLQIESAPRSTALSFPAQTNSLFKYFSEHKEGRGIWKYNHYFESYERHFAKFRGKEVHILEIGVFSGGSLEMWQNYFGPSCKIYGVDIEPRCKVSEACRGLSMRRRGPAVQRVCSLRLRSSAKLELFKARI